MLFENTLAMNKSITETVSPDEVYNVVAGAASQDPSLLSTSSARLKQMLEIHGTYDCLSAIASQKSVPALVRQQAIIQFKNTALNHWRAKRLVSDEQKAAIRSRSLTLLDEPIDMIADFNKHIIAKIARVDFPSTWPNLLTDLMSSADTSLKAYMDSAGQNMEAALVFRRTMEILNAIIKEFASVKMPSGIKVMSQLVEKLHQPLQGYYSVLSTGLASSISPTSICEQPTASSIQLAHLVYKCLCRMAIWAWNRNLLNSFKEMLPWIESFFDASKNQLKTFVTLRTNVLLGSGLTNGQKPTNDMFAHSIDYLTRHIRQFGKLFRRMQQLSCPKFVALNGCGELVLYYWSQVEQATDSPTEYLSDSQFAVYPIRFIVQAMALFKESLGQWSLTKKGGSSAETFPKEFVEKAVILLVNRFIPLNPKDIHEWSEDPEEWANAEDKENELWEYQLRPCGERVLVALANQYRDFVTPMLKASFEQVMSQPSSSLQQIVQKEALYCVIGRCAVRLKEVIPFQQWVAQSLVPEAKSTDPNFPIIKRRIAWLLGKWVHSECAQPSDEIWSILVYLLSDRGPGSDPVVRFTAASAIRESVDSLNFKADGFSPYLAAAITQLIELSSEADTLETKRRITQTINVIIESTEERVIPFVELISNPIPQLWVTASNEGDYLYKASLLETLTKLVEASKLGSERILSLVLSLLQESLSSMESRLQLEDDSFNLWQAALRNANSPGTDNTANLLHLFPTAVQALAENYDVLGTITTIITSYLVLDATSVVQHFGSALFSAYAKALQDSTTNKDDMLENVQLLVQLVPAQAWAEHMHNSGLFSWMLKSLLDDKASTLILTKIVSLFSRIAINNATIFSQLVTASASPLGSPEMELWTALLDQWWRRFDNMYEPRQRKLAAMGIACLVATGRPEVLDRLKGEIFNLWLDVFGEMKEAIVECSEGKDSSSLSSLFTFWRDTGDVLPEKILELEGAPEFERWKMIYIQDPVETQKLTTFVGQRLQEAINICGPQFEAVYLRDADETVVRQLRVELGI